MGRHSPKNRSRRSRRPKAPGSPISASSVRGPRRSAAPSVAREPLIPCGVASRPLSRNRVEGLGVAWHGKPQEAAVDSVDLQLTVLFPLGVVPRNQLAVSDQRNDCVAHELRAVALAPGVLVLQFVLVAERAGVAPRELRERREDRLGGSVVWLACASCVRRAAFPSSGNLFSEERSACPIQPPAHRRQRSYVG